MTPVSVERIGVGVGLSRRKGAGGLPSWILKDGAGNPAAFQLDAANDRGYFKGAMYASEAALLTAVNGSKSGVTRTIGDFVKAGATNFLTNGYFDSGTSPWAINNAANGAVLSNVAGEGEMTSGGSLCVVSQQLPSACNGKGIRLRGKARRGTTTNTFSIGIGINANHGSGPSSPNITTTVMTEYRVHGNGFSSHYADVRNSSGAGSGTLYMDDFVCEECFPFDGWVHENSTLVIKATTPSTISSTQVLFSLDDSDIAAGNLSERDRIRVQQASDGTVSLIATNDNAAIYTQSFGVIPPSTSFTLAIAWSGTTMHCSLNGGAIVTKATGSTLIGACFMHLGRSPTGETWTGTIDNVAYFPSVQTDDWLVYASSGFAANAVFGAGDSGFAGGGTPTVGLGDTLRTMTGRPIASFAAGGTNISQILTAVTSRPYIKGKPLVVFNYSADGNYDLPQNMAYVDGIVAYHGDPSKIVFINSLPWGPDADGVKDASTIALDTLQSYIASKGCITNPNLVSAINALAAGSAQDLKDISASVICASLLSDGTHLFQAPMNVIGTWAAGVLPAS